MTIAIIGGGAIGSLVAGLLAKASVDVLLVGKPSHVEEIRRKGLTVKTTQGEETIPLKAATALDQPYDLAIFATKTQDIEQAYQDNHRFLEDSLILTTQNGVQADNLLSHHFDRSKIISSIVMFGATYMTPGEVTFNFPGDWILGKPFMPNDPRVHAVADILRKVLPVVVTSDIIGMKWLKLFINFNNCIPALTGKSMQETFADMDLCRLSILLLREGMEVVRNAGISFVSLPQFPVERVTGLSTMPLDQAAGIMNKTLTTLSKEPLYGSILQSIMRGKTSEIDFINGEVVALASGTKQDAPLNRRVVDWVHRVEQSGKFFDVEDIKKEFGLLNDGAGRDPAGRRI
ncbi:MAG: 2-dehydropantoate 2-reductase [Candidatus Omnitrophota bacterium]|nr:2-dehydropantoate 2-reductase [Candidatus Omnitrophota bacterium]MDZ4241630.1 2-dehydropantoate 2-reductase [Candidatus Omnitrophota bacterium]